MGLKGWRVEYGWRHPSGERLILLIRLGKNRRLVWTFRRWWGP